MAAVSVDCFVKKLKSSQNVDLVVLMFLVRGHFFGQEPLDCSDGEGGWILVLELYHVLFLPPARTYCLTDYSYLEV